MQIKKINQLKKEIENILNDNKAMEIKSINLKDKTSIADFMIIASGNSSRHIQALSEILLDKLKNRDTAGIINLASVAGFQPTPFMSVYGATKAFDLLFSEALSSELEGSGIDVLAVCPGSTDTEFHAVAGSESTFPKLDDPRSVVLKSLNCLGKRAVYIHGFKHRLLIFFNRLTPRFLVTRTAHLMLKK